MYGKSHFRAVCGIDVRGTCRRANAKRRDGRGGEKTNRKQAFFIQQRILDACLVYEAWFSSNPIADAPLMWQTFGHCFPLRRDTDADSGSCFFFSFREMGPLKRIYLCGLKSKFWHRVAVITKYQCSRMKNNTSLLCTQWGQSGTWCRDFEPLDYLEAERNSLFWPRMILYVLEFKCQFLRSKFQKYNRHFNNDLFTFVH